MFNTKVTKTKNGSYRGRTGKEIYESNKRVAEYKAALEQNARAKALNESAVKEAVFKDAQHLNIQCEGAYRRAVNAYAKSMPEIVLREYFNRLVSESLCLDADFVAENAEAIKFQTHGYIKKLGGMAYLKERCDKTGSGYLNRLYKICTEAGKKIADKKIKKAKKAKEEKDIDNLRIDFAIDEEDKKEIDKDIDTLDVETLSSMVKDKVLQIVQDENEITSKDAEAIQELTDLLSSKNDVSPQENPDDSPVEDKGEDEENKPQNTNESMSRFVKGQQPIRRSLFRSFATKAYKNRICSVSESSTDTLSASIVNNPMNLNVYDIYLQDNNEDLGYIDFVKTSDTPPIAGDDTEIDNDEILAEAIGNYTVLECAFTIKLIAPTEKQITQMVMYNSK